MTGTLLVTGGAGFVGSNVVAEALARGSDVIALVRAGEPRVQRAGVTCVEVDWRTDDVGRILGETRPDAVVHAAGHSGRFSDDVDLPALYEANVATVWQLLDAMRRARLDARAVLVSSAAVYGSSAPVPTPETAPFAPETHYAASKVAAEQIGHAFARLGDAAAIVARPFNALGPGEPPGSVVSRIASQLLRAPVGERATVRLRETASSRDFVDVADLASALVLLAERGEPGAAYNICSGEEANVGDLAARIAAALGRELVLDIVEPASAGTVSVGDPTRLKALGWEPSRTLDETLRRMADAGIGAAR